MRLFPRFYRKKVIISQPEEKVTRYQFGNGRFDLMTDEEVCTFSFDDLESIRLQIEEFQQAKIGGYADTYAQDIYGRLCELLNRYPYKDFRMEVVKDE